MFLSPYSVKWRKIIQYLLRIISFRQFQFSFPKKREAKIETAEMKFLRRGPNKKY
jgi:hypothetical protein